MPKRNAGLIPLTHDHHHALAQARRLRLAAVGDGPDLLDRSRTFLNFFHEDTLNHFREEEEIVFPLVEGDGRATDLVDQLLAEHAAMKEMVASLSGQVDRGEVDASTASELAGALEAHVRLEESRFFPLLETIVDDDRLGALELAPRDRQRQTGPP